MRLEIAAGLRALQRGQRERLSLAWHTAAFQRTDRLPRLERVMRGLTGPRPQQTPAQMQAIAERWQAFLAPQQPPA